MTGRESLAIAFSGAATRSANPSARCSASRFGRELADDQRQVADRDGDQDQRQGAGEPLVTPRPSSQSARGSDSVLAPKAAEKKPAKVTPTCTAARKRLGSLSSFCTAWPRRPVSAIAADLRLAQRDQRDLRAGEDAADQDEDDDHDDAEPDVAHRRRTPRDSFGVGRSLPMVPAGAVEPGRPARPRPGRADVTCVS